MRIAVVGLGKMGRALAERLLDSGHEVSVWNRTASRATALAERGATVMASPDDVDARTVAVYLSLADDTSLMEVAAPQGHGRAAWSHLVVANTSTVSPETTTSLAQLYGEKFLAAPILGAPQAVQSGAATFILGGPAAACDVLAPVWDLFAGPSRVGEDPASALVVKLLHNHMLLAEMTVVAETVRIGRAAGLEDEALAAVLRESPMLAAGLGNRVDGLFAAEHTGWFTNPLAAKDLKLALDLASGTPPLPVTEAARQVYLRVSRDGWAETDITAAVEFGVVTSDE